MNISPLESLVSLLTPPDCAICKVEGAMLCVSCQQTIYAALENRCYLCNKMTKQHRVCQGCSSRSGLRRVWWLDSYSEITKQLVKEMKFHRKRAIARMFGNMLAEALPYLSDDTIVVPVPTANNRVRQRGFDQAVVLARQFASQRGLSYCPALRRLHRGDQIGKSRIERYQQMEHSFVMAEPLPPKATILLVDDVLTTGATLESAARLLRRSGAMHVDACVIARHLV